MSLRAKKSWSSGKAGTPPPLPLPGEDRDALAAFLAANPDFQPDAPPNDYLGDTREMERLANVAGVVLADLDRQIAVTADWLRVEGIA